MDRLDVVGTFDAHIGAIKQRDRGVSGGELLGVLAQCQLLGGHGLVALDRQRVDAAAQLLSTLPGIPSTTAAGLARRFGPQQLAGIESGIATLLDHALQRMPAGRRAQLCIAGDASIVARIGPTIDMDSTDVEVYGPRKRGVAFNYQGQRVGRPHVATWAEAGIAVAADLLAGNQDVRPRAGQLLGRALAAIPDTVSGRPRLRADAGYFTAELAHAADQYGCDYAIAAKRNTALWRAFAGIGEHDWRDAAGMPGAQVAAIDYAPAGWPDDAYTIVRRVRVNAADVSTDPRARRRRTIPAEQLTLALGRQVEHVWAVSFIVTNIPIGAVDAADSSQFASAVEVEAWFRSRTDIEDRIREAKLGAALRHLPSGDHTINTIWMWAALLAVNLSAWLQAITGIDRNGRMHGERLRRELLAIPARVIRHAGRLELRLPPGPQILPEVLARLRALPAVA